MSASPAKTVVSFAAPGAVLLAAAILVRWGGLSTPVVAEYYSWTSVVAASGLAWRFRSSRVLFIVAALWMAERSLLMAGSVDPTASATLCLVALLVPLNLVFFELIGECGVGGTALASGFGVLAIEAAFVTVISRMENADFASWASRAWLPGDWFGWTRIPQPALLAIAIAFALLSTRVVLARKPVECATWWALVSAAIGFHTNGRAAGVYLSTGVAIMAVAMVETGYRLAYHDELTGLPGRRAFNQAMMNLNGRFAIAMVDVDHFKQFNDTYGHDTGDQVLRMVAGRLAKVGGGGKAFRYGGEEFAIVFAHADADEAEEHLETLREAIARSAFNVRGPYRSDRRRPERRYTPPGRRPYGNQTDVASVTVSLGLAQSTARLWSSEMVVEAADRALYAAKKNGRNRVETAGRASREQAAITRA
ncbi:MAG: diguanylate cyclase [Terriglobales bacterium]